MLLGSENGLQIIEQEVWNKRCKILMYKKKCSISENNCLQTTAWIKEQDEDNDGRLNYKEFKAAVRTEIDRLNA